MPPVAKLIEIVKGGNLGQVRKVAIREHQFPFLVKVRFYTIWNYIAWFLVLMVTSEQAEECDIGHRWTIGIGSILTLVEKCCHFFDLMRLFVGANPVRVMASGASNVNHKDEVYDGKVD